MREPGEIDRALSQMEAGCLESRQPVPPSTNQSQPSTRPPQRFTLPGCTIGRTSEPTQADRRPRETEEHAQPGGHPAAAATRLKQSSNDQGLGFRRSEGASGGRSLSSCVFSTGSSGGTSQSQPRCSPNVPRTNGASPAINGKTARRKSAESPGRAFWAWPPRMFSSTLAKRGSPEPRREIRGSLPRIKSDTAGPFASAG